MFKRVLIITITAALATGTLSAGPGLAIFELGKGKKSKAWQLKKFNGSKATAATSVSYSKPKKASILSSCKTSSAIATSKLELVKTLHFPVGSASLTSGTLAGVIAAISKEKSSRVLVSGHTDRQGSWNTNRRLSCQRAMSVKKKLLAKKPGLKVTIEGRAYSKPLVKNESSDADRLKNRRVEVYIIK